MDAPSSSPLSHPKTVFDRLIDALAWIAGVFLVFLVILVCVDVAVRNAPDVAPGILALFLSDEAVAAARKSMQTFSLPWIPELNEYLLYTITFFGAPWVLRDQGHIVVDLVTQTLSPRAKRRAAFVSHLIGAAVCLVLCYYAVLAMIRSINAGNMVVKTWEFPEWLPMMVAPPMFLLLALIFIRWLFQPPAVDSGGPSDGGE